MYRKKVSLRYALEQYLAAENRRVVSDWRALILLRRATAKLPIEQRRWTKPPGSIDEVRSILTRLEHTGDLELISKELSHLYQVTSPYARSEGIGEEEILMEVHPYAALSHITAFVFHQLTDEFPQELHVMVQTDRSSGLLPTGTKEQDWSELLLVSGRRVPQIREHSVRWHQVITKHFFGYAEYQPNGYPVRVTNLERTLLDGLRHPEWCGGLEKVLRAWSHSKDLLNLDRLVQYVDLFNISVLRQRTGFVLEELQLSTPAMAAWPSQARRGGSSKLLGSAPFASTYSERWRLSINAPTIVLHEEPV